MSWRKKIRPEQWCWIVAKLTLACLCVYYLSYPQYGPLRRVHPFVDSLGYSFVIFGCLTSISGLIASAVYWGERMKQGAIIDLVGIIFIVCGTSTFLVGRISVVLREDVTLERALGGILFSFVLTFMFAGRALLKNSLLKEVG